MSVAVKVSKSARCASSLSSSSRAEGGRGQRAATLRGARPPLARGVGLAGPAVGRRSAAVVAALPQQEKTITREDEPEEYWVSKAEKDGKSPMQDPLAIIGIVSIFLPFVLLLIAAALGLVDLSPRV